MDMFRLRVLVGTVIFRNLMAGVLGSVGILTVYRPPKNEAILVIATEENVDVGTWSPRCKLNLTSPYSGRLISHHCLNETSGEVKLTLKLNNSTDEDLTTYICGNGAIDKNPVLCKAEFVIEDTTSATPPAADAGLPSWAIALIIVFILIVIAAVIVVVRNRKKIGG